MTNYIRTSSGRAFPVEPDPGAVCLEDVAYGLARAPRWGAQCRPRYPVAAHAIHVSYLVPAELRFEALNHDSSEAYFCDLPAPYKALLPGYKKLEKKLMAAIGVAFGFKLPLHPLIKAADAEALYLERKALFPFPVGDDVPRVPVTPGVPWDFEKWCYLSPQDVEELFIAHFNNYKPQ